MKEFGHIHKWIEVRNLFVFHSYGDKDIDPENHVINDVMTFHKMSIAFGPYAVGLCLAFIVLFVENLYGNKFFHRKLVEIIDLFWNSKLKSDSITKKTIKPVKRSRLVRLECHFGNKLIKQYGKI